ncbi:MAG: hypothetical protein EOO50_08580 [Flavobacterium sp.]|uniref:hypothetical protein n=1 Tax=Flavobacterium sp. TaxID=239 RepID=UPI0012239ECC|nr:hypothetical protein [Flavobacterium sp.]RZJ66738.1 MAG: hypothetical protein EOO50_08580 [Flavobacterium sp.]
MKQRHFFDVREIEILDREVSYYEKRLGSNEYRRTIRFEEITNVKVAENRNGLVFLGIAVLFVLSSFSVLEDGHEGENLGDYMWLYFLFIAVLAVIFYFYKSDKNWKIFLSTGSFFYIYSNKPNTDAVKNFLDELYLKRDKYLKDKYFSIDKKMGYQNNLQNLNWLKQTKVITDEEFETRTKELKIAFAIDVKVTGFRG